MNLPLITIPYRLTRAFIKKNKQLSFIYGDAYSNRHNYFGQCSDAKGEPNAYLVYTCWKCCTNRPPTNFFRDSEFEDLTKELIDDCIEKIPRDKPIILFPKIGQGCSELEKRSPKAYKYLTEQLNYLAYKNLKRDYNL